MAGDETLDEAARLVREFQAEHAADDPESLAVREALSGRFVKRAGGLLPDAEDDLDELRGMLGELREEIAGGALAEAPPVLRTLAAFMIFEDYTTVGDREWSLYGIADFEDANNAESILGDMKAGGNAPAGVFTFGGDLFLDTLGEVKGAAGAVLSAIGYDLDGAKVLAPSLAAFLAR